MTDEQSPACDSLADRAQAGLRGTPELESFHTVHTTPNKRSGALYALVDVGVAAAAAASAGAGAGAGAGFTICCSTLFA